MNSRLIAFAITILATVAGPAFAHHRRPHAVTPTHTYSWERDSFDLSPVVVVPYVIPDTANNPKQAAFLDKMHLENGVLAKARHWITPPDIRSRDLFVLDITQSLEGGFDSVNLYDRGILSWGIMQWCARYGSLAHALWYIKQRLTATHQARIWNKTFVANGMDVDRAGLIVYGKRVNTALDMRLAFRGTAKVGQYDPKLVNHWAVTMARAGRQSAVAALEVEYAGHIVDALMLQRLPGLPYHAPGRRGLTPSDLAGNDPYSEALIFALWTNNPRNALAYVADAARAARSVSMSDDPSLWAPGAFDDALLRRCRSSHFGNWQARGRMIEARATFVRSAPAPLLCPFEQQYQTVLAARKARRAVELAERPQPSVRVAKTPSSH